MKLKIYNDSLSSLINPKIIKLKPNLYGMLFYVMKIAPAYYIINKALKEKRINSNTKIIETSSGSFAYGVALACKVLGLEYHIITDSYMESSLQNRIQLLGGNLHIASSSLYKSSQESRLELLYETRKKIGESFWTLQYDNVDNRNSYLPFAQFIIECFDDIDTYIIVGSVGSGGSTCGISKYLKKFNKKVDLIGVDCFNSILFGLKPGKRRLGGFGNGIIPKNLDHTEFNQIHWLSDEYCIKSMQELYKEYSLFCGHTTGAAYLVANQLAKENPHKKIIFIGPDSGERYLSTYYNIDWLTTNGYNLPNFFSDPKLVLRPIDAVEPWSYMCWNNRSLKVELENA